jgi:hypothetical protein
MESNQKLMMAVGMEAMKCRAQRLLHDAMVASKDLETHKLLRGLLNAVSATTLEELWNAPREEDEEDEE